MDFMEIAIKEAKKGMKKKEGGPFGAVIVCDGKIVASAHNTVLKDNDPTAHAEINAIRKAAKKLKNFDLSNCELYTTCEPCPMCYSAIHWGKIKKVYYGATAQDAAKIGFIDKKLKDILSGKKKSNIKMKKIDSKECVDLMSEFTKLNGKLY
ncbi:MAG: nucleoside deaminase [archaeon]|jgi:guanine deaminase